ncbi:MAG: hypothetical protein WD824_15215 [Cyclobacteriaceae bacterium]
MIDPEKDISNLDFPIAKVIREALSDLPPYLRKELLGSQPENEFISNRVDIYLLELENAMHAGYDELGSKEIALKECLHGLRQSDGEVFEA